MIFHVVLQMAIRMKQAPKNLKKERKKPNSRAFNERRPRFTLYSPLGQLPDEFDAVILTNGIYNSAATTASISSKVVTNSLLVSDHAFTTGGESTLLDDFALGYSSYRVVRYKIEAQYVGRDDQRVLLALFHTPIDPSFAAGSVFNYNSTAYPRSQVTLVGTNTDSPNVGSMKDSSFSIIDVAATDAVMTDDKYVGSISSSGVFTSPATQTFAIFHYAQVDGTNFSANSAPLIRVKMTQWVKFFSRRS